MLGEIVAMLEERAIDGAAQLDGATAWLDRMKPLTAGHFVRWLPQSYRNAMALVDGVRARHGLELDWGPKAAPSFTRTARDAGLHEPEPDPKEPQILGERAARERARREHELAFRRVDARALMEVRREAASRGEVSLGRFNAAYRRLHPAFDRAERRRRALVLTHRGRRIEATVRGPHGAEFSISRPADTDERAVIAALLYRIEMVVGRSAGQPKARAVDSIPKDTKDTHEPNLDADALAQEPGTHAGTAGLAGPEALAAVMQELEQLTSSFFGRPKPEATDTAPELKDQQDAGAVEEGHEADEPVDATERTVEGASAGPEPRSEAVEQEGIVLVAGPGAGTGVLAPTEHPPSLLDVVELHPAVLELAERGARRPSPDTSAPPNGRHGVGDTGFAGNELKSTRTCSGGPMALVSPRASATTVTAAPSPPRAFCRTIAPCRARHVAPVDSPPSWARPSVTAPPAASLRPRTARPPGTRSPRGPPSSSVSRAEGGLDSWWSGVR